MTLIEKQFVDGKDQFENSPQYPYDLCNQLNGTLTHPYGPQSSIHPSLDHQRQRQIGWLVGWLVDSKWKVFVFFWGKEQLPTLPHISNRPRFRDDSYIISNLNDAQIKLALNSWEVCMACFFVFFGEKWWMVDVKRCW